MNNNTLPKMRTPHNAIKELQQADPKTELTERALRRLILTGEIPSVRIGNKYLVNMETLFDYLKGSPVEPQNKVI